ncbi:MAG: peptidoglycan DD-metalloendopeptidase family protein [Ghiorsea sp.]|nr:peptidoglycan DD-metalloendopeptidase family protein [Ghiorsea sp.]
MVALSLLMVLLLLVFAVTQGGATPDSVVVHEEWLEADVPKVQSKQVEHVKSGDTAGLILKRLGFSASEAARMIDAAKAVYPLQRIYVGHTFTREVIKGKAVVYYYIDANQKLELTALTSTSWKAALKQRSIFSRVSIVKASIQDSLFWDAAKAGLADNVILKMVDMFAWDIDFSRDLRKGDSFQVMFEESFDDKGQKVGYKILAATFTNRGHVYSGIRYETERGVEYYDVAGRNLRKTYLKSPVKYSRISSRFRSSRKHPVLGYTRAHRGVDYAAKTGTPIRAIGDGKIVYKGWKGGYGRFIEVRHNNGIHSTAYAHMSRYAKGMKRNKHVKQGQIIGYVGMSGLATGPHLHFEFRSRGRAVNPLKVKHKPAKPVPQGEINAFNLQAKAMMLIMAQFDPLRHWG